MSDTSSVVCRIEIERTIEDSGALVDYFRAVDQSGERLPLVETLGMLRLAEDTAIRQAMGEASE